MVAHFPQIAAIALARKIFQLARLTELVDYDTNFLVMRNSVSYLRAIADETRYRIAHLLRDQTLCVCELADILGMPISSLSSHLQILRKAEWLNFEKREKWTYYRIKPEHLAFLSQLETQFSESNDAIFHADAVRAAARLAVRESSCCPAPLNLSI